MLVLDEELIEKFEDGSLPISLFHHDEHVRIAFLYLLRYPVLEVLERFPTALKRYAAMHGKAGLYHETISWAYIFIINERVLRAGSAPTWEMFRAANADLLDRTAPILGKYYREETISSPAARERFVMPDRC